MKAPPGKDEPGVPIGCWFPEGLQEAEPFWREIPCCADAHLVVAWRALYRTATGQASATDRPGDGRSSRLNSGRSTAYNPATGAGLRLLHGPRMFGSKDGFAG